MVPFWYCACMLNLQGIHTEKKIQLVCVCVRFQLKDICAKCKAIKTKKRIRRRGRGICVNSAAPGPMYETNGRLKKWWFVYHVKIKATDSTLANKLRFVPNKKTIFFPLLCAYVPWSWQTEDNAWQIRVHYFESKHNFQNMLYCCPLQCWHFLAHIKFHLTRKNKTSFENTIAGWRIQQTSHSHLGCPYLPPMASIIKKLTRKGYVRHVHSFNDHATLGSVTNEVQKYSKPKPCRQHLRVKNLQQWGLRHTTRSNRHLCPNIELVTSFMNCCLGAKGMSQYTDPFVAHPFLAEHRRHQKKHCQVSATKSCMASFSQGRFVEHLGSRKSPISLAAKGFTYCSSMSRAWTDMPIAHDNIM